MTDPNAVRTRFAPSPTGHLHVGGARTALFCWAYARRYGGAFVLRIEDTDQRRSSESATAGFQQDLLWLGVEWDEGPAYEHDGAARGGGPYGPYFQSERLDHYDAALDRLLASGRAYRAFETAEELDAKRAEARAANQAYRYDRAALELDEATVRRFLDEGRPHVVRFRVPDDEEVVIEDEVLGTVRVSTAELDDFVIRKADGFPTYHFAVVVDDEHMRITHVIRGQEHLNNTVRHVLLQDALGCRRPAYAHLSLIFNPDGSKMSKRDKDKALRAAVRQQGIEGSPAVDPATFAAWLADKDRQLDVHQAAQLAEELGVELPEIEVDDFRRAGYLPEVMVNYLALLGWSPGEDVEKFGRDFLVERFGLDRVVKSPAKFDRDKLLAFNLDAIQGMSEDDWVAAMRAHAAYARPEFLAALGDEAFELFARANKGRSKTLDERFRTDRFFIMADDELEYPDTKPVRKALCKGEPCGFDHLGGVAPVLAGLEAWTLESIESALDAYAAEHADGRMGNVAQPLRVAVTGGTVSPGIHETLVILGRERVLARIEQCLASRDALAGAAAGREGSS